MYRVSSEYSDDLFETKAEAITRARMMMEWNRDFKRLMVQREWAPGWLAWLVQYTKLDWIAWEQVERRTDA